MDENDEHHTRGRATDDGGNPEKGIAEPGEMLTRRLVGATREISRGDERFRAEEGVLADIYAEGVINFQIPDELPDFVGSEHEVWSGGIGVLKATLPGAFGRRWGSRRFASPTEYLRRIQITREEFSIKWTVKGICKEAGRIRIVTEQPYFRGERPDLGEIDTYMSRLGFEIKKHRFGDCWYRNEDQVLVFDAEPGNFVKTPNGLVPVDLIVQHENLESIQ